MEKELLEKRKAALKKLLDNRQYFCSGLCHLINGLYTLNILTLDECIILNELIDSYFENSEKGYAIKIKNTKRYKVYYNIYEKYGVKAPQSFSYLED